MAEELDNPSFGSFSIEDTLDMGMGSAQLINDLFSSETSTGNPDDIEKIVKTVEDPAPAAPKARGKVIVPKEEGEEETPQNTLANFLGDAEDEDESDDNITQTAPLTEDDDDAPADSPFVALSRDLFKLGVFTKDEDEEDAAITSPEEFLERFNAEKKKGAIQVVDDFIGQFGEDYQKAFEAIFVKGVNPKDYFGAYNNVVNFAEMDLTDENNQVRVLKQALTDQGFDQEDVTTEIERLRNYGDLESVATKHHKVLVKRESAKLQEMEQQAQQDLQQKSAIRNQYISNVQSIVQDKLKTKEFDGIPINPKLANELQDFLLVDKYKLPSGELLTDFDKAILEMKRPENHAMKVKVGLLLKILEKDPTLSTIQKSGVTKKSNELFGEVARQVTKGKPSGSSQAKSNSWFQ